MTHHWSTLDATTGKIDTRPKSMEQDVKLPAQKKNVRLLPYLWEKSQANPCSKEKARLQPLSARKATCQTLLQRRDHDAKPLPTAAEAGVKTPQQTPSSKDYFKS